MSDEIKPEVSQGLIDSFLLIVSELHKFTEEERLRMLRAAIAFYDLNKEAK